MKFFEPASGTATPVTTGAEAPVTPEGDMSILESLFGVDIPDAALWIALGVVILVAVVFVAWGFIKEVKKK